MSNKVKTHGNNSVSDRTMTKSQALKHQIEEFWGDLFSDALGRYHSHVREVHLVESQENPPDALYDIQYSNDDKARAWAEITNVYPSNAAAEHVFRVARGQCDNSVEGPNSGALLENPDTQISQVAIQRLLNKIDKDSYSHLCSKYGRGHLLLVFPYQVYPLVNGATAEQVKSDLPLQVLERQLNFRSVWMAYKQPDCDDGMVIVHLPDSTPSYCFIRLWQGGNDPAL